MRDVGVSGPSRIGGPSSKGLRRRIGFIASLAVVAGFALPAPGAQAITPTIVNNSDTSAGFKAWLESPATSGEANGNSLRLTLLVKHDPGRSVTGVKIDDDWNGTDETTTKTVKTTTLQQPTVQGGYEYSRVPSATRFRRQIPG